MENSSSANLDRLTVACTGVTGFIGSALAAGFLARGARVVALSRDDASGNRTRAAVRNAMAGNEFLPAGSGSAWEDRLIVASWEPGKDPEIADSLRSGIDLCWHVAANMKYDLAEAPRSFADNVGGSVALFEYCERALPKCRRFYHVSTAFTAGVAGGEFREQLHFRPPLVNAYVISKWGAEHSLANRSASSRLKVSIVRPSIVVGSSRTGWCTGAAFGYYMFVNAVRIAVRMGMKKIRLPVPPGSRPNLIAIDEFVGAGLALSARDANASPGLEIFHVTSAPPVGFADSLNVAAARTFGVEVEVGAPESDTDHRISSLVQENRDFGSSDYVFNRECLDAALKGSGARITDTLSVEQLVRINQGFLKAL